MMVGAYAGNRLGAVRDAKGKAVATVFAELGGTQKAEVSILCILRFSATDHSIADYQGFGDEDIWHEWSDLNHTLVYFFFSSDDIFCTVLYLCIISINK